MKGFRSAPVLLIAFICLLALMTDMAGTANASGFQGQADKDGFVVSVSSDGSLTVGGGSGGSSGDPLDAVVVVSYCAEVVSGGLDCSALFERYCAGFAADDEANRWRPALMMTRRQAAGDPLGPGGTWSCLNFAHVIDAGPDVGQVREALEAALPAAEATTNPRVSATTGMVETLVHLPLILHFEGDRQLSVERLVGGHRVVITAYAARFVWRVGDQVVDTDEAGRAWNARFPCDQRSCPGYLSAEAFERVGRYPLNLMVQWAGSYQVDGGPAAQIPGMVSRLSPQLSVNVREARAELISGDDEFD